MKHYIRTFFLLLYFTFSMTVFAQQKLIGNKSFSSNSTNTQALSDNESPNENLIKNDSLLNIGNLLNVKLYSFYSQNISYHQLTSIDTTLHDFEFYNPNKQPQSFSQDLGITGSANTPLILQFKPQVSFNLGIKSYDLFIRDLSEVELIETPTPFTQLSYVQGAKKENILRVQHAQSFLDKQIKAGIDFKLFNTVGYYANQNTDVKNFNGNIAYRTKDHRYSVEGVYFHNKLVLSENGGITYDSLYEQNNEPNRQIISVNLANAENLVKYSGVGIIQNFYLSKAEPDFSAIPDTNVLNLEGYSVYHYKKPYFDPITPHGRLSHTFTYSKEIYLYTDSDGASTFYANIPNFPEDVTNIFDSISHRKIENIFFYSNAAYKDNSEHLKFLTYSFGLGLVSNRYAQDTLLNTLSELNPQGKLQFSLTNNINLKGSGIYSYRSDNTAAYQLKGEAELSVKKNKLNLSFSSASTQASWIYQHFYSTYFQWENNFQNQKYQEFKLQYNRKSTLIIAKLGLIHDYLYFDTSIVPQQYNVPLSYFSVSAFQGIRLGDFGIDINIIYQGVSDKNILRVPNLYSNTKLYYTNTIFDGALDLELGLNIRYFSAYYANAYMPALRSFYIQNEQTFGNYPYFDVFVNAKIKRARLFFKYEQLNTSFMPQNYFISPHYPNPDASISFGLIWQLFN
ncbi:MAG: hypothetical protein J7J72_03535 [Bacteroidales bacterium]|nr:hypothetical protein [Bacteroidales bacterium]